MMMTLVAYDDMKTLTVEQIKNNDDGRMKLSIGQSGNIRTQTLKYSRGGQKMYTSEHVGQCCLSSSSL